MWDGGWGGVYYIIIWRHLGSVDVCVCVCVCVHARVHMHMQVKLLL